MRYLLWWCAGGLLAAEPNDTLDRLLLANRVRADLAREQAAHQAEVQRLEALRAAVEAAIARHEEERQAAEVRTAAAAPRTVIPGDAVDAALAPAVDALEAALAPVAAALPPGTLPPAAPAGAGLQARFDAAVLRLEAAERAAATVAVSVVTGTRPDGTALAVKPLRIGGTARWWLSLDGQQAGVASGVSLQPEPALRPAIAAAIAQAEGRDAPGIVTLPVEVAP